MFEDQAEWVDWRIWQIIDSAFPTGSFAHSGGLESASTWGEIGSIDDVVGFVQDALRHNARIGLPLLRAVFQSPSDFEKIDEETDVFLNNHIANRASRSQGRAILATCADVFRTRRLQELRELSSIEEIHAHQAPVMGLVAQQLEIPLNIAARKFVFCNMRDLLSAAVRLNVIGPVQAQIVQDHIRDVCEKIISDCSDLELHQKTQTAPFLELLQATHERIYSKLFQS